MEMKKVRLTYALFDTYCHEIHGCEGPVFGNLCPHDADEYLGSVKQLERRDGVPVVAKYDVYVHEGPLDGADVCIRYGDEGREYVSAGSVLDFLAMAASRRSHYPAVASLLVAKLDFFCERKG